MTEPVHKHTVINKVLACVHGDNLKCLSATRCEAILDSRSPTPTFSIMTVAIELAQ